MDESQPIWLQKWKVLKSGGATTYIVKDCHTLRFLSQKELQIKIIKPGKVVTNLRLLIFDPSRDILLRS